MLIVRGVNLFPSTVEQILLAIPGLTGNYQLVVDRTEQRHETLQVLVEAASGAGDHDALERMARERIKETIGLTFDVTVLPAGVLPRSEGKAKRVIDRRDVTVKA
jgi:phenylacetate-CoA ligase